MFAEKETPADADTSTGANTLVKGCFSMDKIVAQIEIRVNGQGRYALRECSACGELCREWLINALAGEQLADLAGQDWLCGFCKADLAEDLAQRELEQALVGYSFQNQTTGVIGEVTEIDHDLGHVVLKVYHDPAAGNWNQVNYTERVSLDSFEQHYEAVDGPPPGDWGNGYERQVEHAMVGG